VRLAGERGWPLLADPMSGLRRGPAAVAHYDALLRAPGFAAEMRPDAVLRIGDLPVSKPLRGWLAGLADIPQVALDPEQAWQDPDAVLSMSIAVDPDAALQDLPVAGEQEWLERWRTADGGAASALRAALLQEPLSEPGVALELAAMLGGEHTLFVASSMPVRDIETVWPAADAPPRVLCNRGANGIDGTVSSAFGAAAALGGGEQAILLIGDVALAHDIGGLLAARRLSLKLTIVLVNNDGGGIFDFLPVSCAPFARGATEAGDDLYTRHVATPTGLDFARAAALYGLEHERAESSEAFRAALGRALARAEPGIVEVRSERARNVEVHRRMWEAVAASLSR
jgi:2-succinyl-5-enolpyruvyl-6-hydroxy-3-cyclohexene-1-carboxylate synthase